MISRRHMLAGFCLIVATCVPGPAGAQQSQGVSATEIVLGTHQDLSGPVAALGTSLRDGLLIAADAINESGGIHGRKIRLVIEDSGFDPKKAILATQKMLERDHIFALIAPLGSAPVAASMPLALDAGVPVLFSGTPADFTYTPYNRIKFGLAVPYGEQVRAEVKYAVEKLGKKRFGILYQDDETGRNVLNATETQLKVHGMELAARASYKRGDVDFSSQIARLKDADVDVVILGTIIRETAAAMIESRKQGWPVDMMVSQAGMNNAIVKIGGDAVEGLYAMAQFLSLNAQDETPRLAEIVRRYRARFNKDPDDGMIYGYVVVMLFAEAARKAGPDLNVDSLVAGLEQVKDFKTDFVGAPVSYGPNLRLGSRATILTRVKGGKFLPLTGPMTYD